jgi:hypothetical protein
LGLRSRPQQLLIYTICFYFKQSLVDSAVAKGLAHFSSWSRVQNLCSAFSV